MHLGILILLSKYSIVYLSRYLCDKHSILMISCKTGLCSWVQEVSDDLNWTLSSGLQVDQPWDGPQYDHTVENNAGTTIDDNISTNTKSIFEHWK